MSRSVLERLKDARSFARVAELRVAGLDRDVFCNLPEVRFVVYYCLIGIGEALKDVPAEVLANEPEISWDAVIGIRNRLVHAYWRIDDDLVYEAVTLELPALCAAIGRLSEKLK